MHPKDISIADYTYALPEERIALFPLQERDASKLLIYKEGNISEDRFCNISNHLPANSLLVFNDTKVIHARLEFFKATGARIEVFCLEPAGNISEYISVMAAKEKSVWKCFVGGAAKWKDEALEKDILISGQEVKLYARKISQEGEVYIIELSWEPAHFSFAEIIDAAGKVPLPPYIKRNVGVEDESRYQTIFARQEGSVAAPTAGLHFSEAVFEKLQQKNIKKAYLTLHVGAGTFKPVKATTMAGHEMHAEYMDVSKKAIETILGSNSIAAVGTTSLRTLESLYWLGVKARLMPDAQDLNIEQWDAYEETLINSNLNKEEALQALLLWLEKNGRENIFTKTQLLITPGYSFKVADILITNFHQPQSTLLLLVAAVIGKDWKQLYDYALQNDFRFLSYGDSNLIFIKQ